MTQTAIKTDFTKLCAEKTLEKFSKSANPE